MRKLPRGFTIRKFLLQVAALAALYAVVAIVALLCLTHFASAQRYAWYPSYYGGGYYRGGYYGGGLGPSCGSYGCYAQRRYAYQAPRPVYRPPVRYNWYGGPPRAYLGGRGDGWGGEW